MVLYVMPRQSLRPTLRDVARRAGVSYQSVSRVINGQVGVSAETRDNILAIMEEMNFRPNRAAQMLATQRSHTLEVITIYPRTMMLRDGLESMAFTAWNADYHLVCTIIEPNKFARYVRDAQSRLVDGMILIAPNWVCGISDEMLLELAGPVPFVQMMAQLGSRLPSVIQDQMHGARVALQYLIDCGHRHIAEIRGPLDSFEADIRHEGWVTTLQYNGLTPALSVAGDTFQVESGYRAAKALLASGQPFTALYTANDRLALGALYAFHEGGLRVPDDISVIGYDDIEHAAFFTPALTTMRVDHATVARLVVEYLVELIKDPQVPLKQHVILPELIVRQSVKSIHYAPA
jgi:DNA-binding LacI/PurR family transcriptional regulator